MNEALPPSRRPGIRAAMFVDFDNVFTGLQALDPLAAKRFAEDPKHWADALSAGGSGEDARRFLIRNCYLNPVVYSKYRTYWTRAGFRVIDCPSLTQRGKSSTDINLVLDAMDALSGNVGIEEFFIASADADFTSLIQRFRAADRMTTVIAAGAVAFAYREMADHVVESHDFVAILNGSTVEPVHAVASGKHQTVPAAAKAKAKSASPAIREVLEFVRAAPGPVNGAMVAHRALTAEPSLKTDWGGWGKFGTWVSQIGQGVEYSPAQGGWVWDAKRFSSEDLPAPADLQPGIEEQVTRVTDVPALSAAQFRQMFHAMEARLREHPLNRTELSRQVRDDCVNADQPVSRNAVSFVLQGLAYVNFPLTDEATAEGLAAAWTANVEELCRVALLEFDAAEKLAVRRWASGGLLDA
ncbi:NYN domain-containing protein [Pseudarthrobacter raffinosi]|uniref:NYN domain-containing protein n=1 Tax=Pseudarthrobacter raffinosi TaxID=2953651 RepID=UPI00208E6B50|nr:MULTISPECIES: NYN domain-containing protein [unclassified Pseudarthrobacter]MCO4238184.1 NYN domain-containing protein [Pseudarthrobacter sp. MDT3-28]MCO4252624.1 NYN domain-containing protein [Pseudarthrobacter sp. MDT3-9]MCO4264482.1 NYN domain-containing protein [Pseudarthrobacter sp. MDT3-26]